MRHTQEEGAALLAVLILVAVLGGLSAGLLDRLTSATAIHANASALDQARAAAAAAEVLATVRIDDLVAGSAATTLAGSWQARWFTVPLPQGRVQVRVTDGGNCFNLNSMVHGNVAGVLTTRPTAVVQFVALATMLGIAPDAAQRVADSLADWIDSDHAPNPNGGEDVAYAQAEPAYRTGGTLLAEVSELRAVAGVTPAIYQRLRPWLCALPTSELSPINVNTLRPEQAPLVAMLLPGELGLAEARAMIEARPRAGWTDLALFWRGPALRGLVPTGDVQNQPRTRTRFFALDIVVTLGEPVLRETALVDAGTLPSRLVVRRWTEDQ